MRLAEDAEPDGLEKVVYSQETSCLRFVGYRHLHGVGRESGRRRLLVSLIVPKIDSDDNCTIVE